MRNNERTLRLGVQLRFNEVTAKRKEVRDTHEVTDPEIRQHWTKKREYQRFGWATPSAVEARV